MHPDVEPDRLRAVVRIGNPQAVGLDRAIERGAVAVSSARARDPRGFPILKFFRPFDTGVEHIERVIDALLSEEIFRELQKHFSGFGINFDVGQ